VISPREKTLRHMATGLGWKWFLIFATIVHCGAKGFKGPKSLIESSFFSDGVVIIDT
jgi:hypothetical protein